MFKRLQVLKHEEFIKSNGINMFNVINDKHLLVQKECYKNKINHNLGNLQYKQTTSLMMSPLMILQETITLHKLLLLCRNNMYVPHVVLLLHGQSLQNQSH